MAVSYTHLDVYKRQVTNYSITAGSSNDASVDVVTKGASARDHFMMANSEAAMVNICLLYTSKAHCWICQNGCR